MSRGDVMVPLRRNPNVFLQGMCNVQIMRLTCRLPLVAAVIYSRDQLKIVDRPRQSPIYAN